MIQMQRICIIYAMGRFAETVPYTCTCTCMYIHIWGRENMVVFKCYSRHKSYAPQLKVGLTVAKLKLVWNL